MESLLETLQRKLKVLKMFRAVKGEYNEYLVNAIGELINKQGQMEDKDFNANIEYLNGKIDELEQVIDLIKQSK